MKTGMVALGLAGLLFGKNPGDSSLRSLVFLIKPHYQGPTMKFLDSLASILETRGNEETATWLRGYAGVGFGTGFLIKSRNNRFYIVTGRHAVEQAERVSAIGRASHGAEIRFDQLQVLHASDEADLAIIDFPDGEKYHSEALEYDAYDIFPERTKVLAAGYTGSGSDPQWKVYSGEITNGKVATPGIASNPDVPLIQHSARIGRGGGGGPLLVENPKAPLGYAVAGINVMKAHHHGRSSYAIPSWVLEGVLNSIEGMESMMKNHEQLIRGLQDKCRSLAFEFSSEHPRYEDLFRFISYDFVARRGPQSFLNMSAIAKEVDWDSELLADPTKTMKLSLFMNMIHELKTVHPAASIEFDHLNAEDLKYAYADNGVRTVFRLDGKAKREIVWKIEYGEWKISDFKISGLGSPAREIAQTLQETATTGNGTLHAKDEEGKGEGGLPHEPNPPETPQKEATPTMESAAAGHRMHITLHLNGVASMGAGRAYNYAEPGEWVRGMKPGASSGAAVQIAGRLPRNLGWILGLRYFNQKFSYRVDATTLDGILVQDIGVTDILTTLQAHAMLRYSWNGFFLGMGGGVDQFRFKKQEIAYGGAKTAIAPYLYRDFAYPFIVGLGLEREFGKKFCWGAELLYDHSVLKVNKPEYYEARIGSLWLGAYLGLGMF